MKNEIDNVNIDARKSSYADYKISLSFDNGNADDAYKIQEKISGKAIKGISIVGADDDDSKLVVLCKDKDTARELINTLSNSGIGFKNKSNALTAVNSITISNEKEK